MKINDYPYGKDQINQRHEDNKLALKTDEPVHFTPAQIKSFKSSLKTALEQQGYYDSKDDTADDRAYEKNFVKDTENKTSLHAMLANFDKKPRKYCKKCGIEIPYGQYCDDCGRSLVNSAWG